ncbi:MAG: carboxypeptidase regulatory-like domain-containing protein [Acidobacteriota bacterium]
MRSSLVRRLILICALLAVPGAAYAQEAELNGTVTDATGAVLPGVTIRAVHEASGNSFEGVTDARGAYQIRVRVGGYVITAELQGFTTVTRRGLELLVGQTAAINLQMTPSGVAETVTVTAATPLIEVTQSKLGGNIDPRQVADLPSQGRNWMSLALLAPGNRTNQQGALPVQDRVDVREFQLNVDGQQVTSNLGTGNQSRYSNDSIAEFQFISNRFDATQGRSSGVQVNAITRSGTNMFAGSLVGNFRDSKFNAEDPVLKQVLPYANQQISGTFGGPILENRLHFFANYEYERQPLTSIWNTPYPQFNVSLSGIRNVRLGGVRVDEQVSSRMRLMGKVSRSTLFEPFGPGTSNHPSATNSNDEHNTDVIGQVTNVLSNRALNEVRVGYASYGINQQSLTSWSNHWQAQNGITTDGPSITFTGFSFNRNNNLPRYRDQSSFSIRDDFTLSYEAGGRHDLKLGGEYLRVLDETRNCNRCGGVITAQGGPVPANIEALFPDAFNADTWNLAAISNITTRYTVGVSDSSAFLTPIHMWKYGGWAQDNWKVASGLTLNLGIRYDLIWNAFAQNVTFPPFEMADRPQDANNFQPRAGFAYQIGDKTVVRGGTGLYYNDILNTNVLWPMSPLTIAVIAVDNDRTRPDFAANPFNGPLPTYDQALQRFCNVNNVPGCLLRDLQEQAPIPDYAHVTHSVQSSIGFARQFGTDIALEMDYVNTRSRDEKSIQDNVNITFDPATGIPYPYSNAARRAFPLYGVVGMIPHTGQSDYHGLQTSVTKRMSHRWQGSLTYTLAGLWDQDPQPISGFTQVSFPVVQDLGGERSLAESDQRHRLVFNGIWQVSHGFQVSGLYFYGSGQRSQIVCGCDARGLQIVSVDRLRNAAAAARVGAEVGSIIPRESFVGAPIHRVDIRLQQRVPLGGQRSIDGFLDIFNAFNRANYGSYELRENNAAFGQPTQSTNLSFAPRTLQLGFRFRF